VEHPAEDAGAPGAGETNPPRATRRNQRGRLRAITLHYLHALLDTNFGRTGRPCESPFSAIGVVSPSVASGQGGPILDGGSVAVLERKASMEFVHEVTAFLENKPGRLAKICSALAQEKVDIRALSVMESEGPSVLRFVTNDLNATKSVLTSLGTEFRIAEVLAVQVENGTGSLARVLEKLAEEHINVEYAYASTAAAPGKALGIFHTSNPKRACQILNEASSAASGPGRSGGRRPLHSR
jgi:hypothetical protein